MSGNLVFAGNGYVIHKTKTNPYQGLDVHGKIIVVAGLPPELAAQQGGGGRGGRGDAPDQPAAGRGAPNPLGENCTDFLTPEAYAAKNGALAVVTVASFQQLTAMANPAGGRGGGAQRPQLPGKEVSGDAHLSRCAIDHRGSGADQRALPGREAERRPGVLRHGFQHQAGFL